MATIVPANSLGVLMQWLRRSASFLWLAVLAGYLSLLAGQAVLHTYQEQQQNDALQQKLADTQLEKERLQALLVYYGTDSFKEKELRRSLLMIKPGEQLYALPESGAEATAEEEVHKDIAAANQPSALKEPIWKQWVLYLEDRKG